MHEEVRMHGYEVIQHAVMSGGQCLGLHKGWLEWWWLSPGICYSCLTWSQGSSSVTYSSNKANFSHVKYGCIFPKL
jgi:hypothetical protein